jgi:hypothetical protein
MRLTTHAPSMKSTARALTAVIAVLGLLAAPAAASAMDFGKVRGWWPMNEGRGQVIYDWSGNGNRGMLGSTPTVDANDPSWIKGIFFGSALRFGGDDFVSIPNDTTLQPSQFTVSMWVRAPQSPGPFKDLIAKGSNQGVAASWGLWTGSHGGIDFYVWNGRDLVRAAGTPNEVWDGRWHNVTGTYDGFQTKLYLDGRDLGNVPGSADPLVYDQPDGTTSIGGYRGSCDLLFSGDIDQVMLFDKALPIPQIWARYGSILGLPTLQ